MTDEYLQPVAFSLYNQIDIAWLCLLVCLKPAAFLLGPELRLAHGVLGRAFLEIFNIVYQLVPKRPNGFIAGPGNMWCDDDIWQMSNF